MQKNDYDKPLLFIFVIYGAILLLALNWRINWC